MIFNKKKWVKQIGLALLGLNVLWIPKCDVLAESGTKIHFISLYSSTDAILLESNGHYGMIDSGEDWDYPDGSNDILRDGVTKEIGYEQQVVYYLRKLGVDKLDFYIATHAHSDHIGSGDEILRNFPTERLYINKYSDSNISDEIRLWDNQYVYDRLLNAAQETGTQIITDLDLQENQSNLSFSMGEMQIEIMNHERERDESGNYVPVPDDNCNSLVTKVTAFQRVALLTSDIDPWVSDTAEYGDTVKIVNQLMSKSEGEESEMSGVIDEMKPNTGRTVDLDLLKMSHHANDYNNTTYFLTSLNPETVVVTGFESHYNAREKECLPNAQMFATATDSAAVVAEFNEDGIHTKYVKMASGWMDYEGGSYYFDENGRTFTDEISHVVDGKEYCFNKKGAVVTTDQWVLESGAYRYWYADGRFAYDEWIENEDGKYYCDENGNMVTGWTWIDDSCYYFDDTGKLEIDGWIDGHYLDEDGKWVKELSVAEWRKSGNHWWYRYGNGIYASEKWVKINHEKYYFDAAGWMLTGWQNIDGFWYYFKKNGCLAVNTWIGDCYVDETGVWNQEYTEDRWINSGGNWWYRHGDGTYTRSGFEEINGKQYYFDAAGWMVTGWKKVDGKWYYFEKNGVMAVDKWIGNCYVDQSGVWIQNVKPSRWIKSGGNWWYCHGDGSYTRGAFEKINEKWYFFDANGWMVTGWKKISGDWYYFAKNGVMQAGVWVGEYYLKADGIMAVNEWVDNGKYYVNEFGVCQYTANAWTPGRKD